MLNLEVSTPQGSELHLELCGQQEPVLLIDLSTPQEPELHLALSGQHKSLSWSATCIWMYLVYRNLPLLLLDVSTLQITVLSYSLHHRDMSYTWKLSGQKPVLLVDVSTLEGSGPKGLAPGHVYTTDACAGRAPWPTPQKPKLHLKYLENQQLIHRKYYTD